MSGKIYDYFKRVGSTSTKAKPEAEMAENGGDVVISTKNGGDAVMASSTASEASSDVSSDSVGFAVQNNKRKRLEESEGVGNFFKRRSEEPLVKISSVKTKQHEVIVIDEETITNGEDVKKVERKQSTESDSEKEEEYEVEEIVDYQYCKVSDQGLYYVKWIGWPSEDNTWEPEANLDCAEKLAHFYRTRLKERESASPAEKRALELPPDPRETFQIRQDFIKEHCPHSSRAELDELFKLEKSRKKVIKVVAEPILNAAIDSLARSKDPNEKKLKFVKEQLMAREMREAREKQQREIRAWEHEINTIDKNSARIVVENDVDLEGPPRRMKYINQYMPSGSIVLPDDPPMGCECPSCEVKTEKNCCPGIFGFNMAYTKHAKLRVEVGTPIYECNKKCKCTKECYNRVVQGGRKHKLAIYRTDNGCGWGVKALENIKAGSFVVDYVGEVITSEEAEERGKKYDAEGRTYLFDLDFNLGDDNIYTVDAAFYGNMSHFVNHSCDPNLNIFNVYINCLDPNLPQLALFARREIKRGEQITFDYCQQTNKSNTGDNDEGILASPFTQKTPAKVEKVPERREVKSECRCGAPRCRKVLF